MSHQHETVYEDKERREFTRHTGIQSIPLQKTLKIKLQFGGKPCDFTVEDWYYDATDPVASVLHIIVRKVPQPGFDNLPKDTQDIIQAFIVLVLLAIVGIASYVVYIYNNQSVLFWGYIGKCLRWSVLALIIIVGFGLILRIEGYINKKKRTFWGVFLGLAYTLVTMILAGYWFFISIPKMELVNFPEDYAQYVTYIQSQVQANIVVPMASLAWLLAILKIIGWERFVSITETVLSVFRGK
jgi:hypothetical protein